MDGKQVDNRVDKKNNVNIFFLNIRNATGRLNLNHNNYCFKGLTCTCYFPLNTMLCISDSNEAGQKCTFFSACNHLKYKRQLKGRCPIHF